MSKSTPSVWPDDGAWVIVVVLDAEGNEIRKRAKFDRASETFTPVGERPIIEFQYYEVSRPHESRE